MSSVPSIPLEPAQPTLLNEFRILFPEFENFKDEVVQLQLRLAAPMVDKARWGDMYSYGLGLVAAHRLALGQAAAAADGSVNLNGDRVVLSKSVGGVAVSYSAPNQGTTSADAYWGTTPYGRQFLALVQVVGAGVIQL